MQLAKSIMLKSGFLFSKIFLFIFFLLNSVVLIAQDNSPYSRYGLGNEFPRTNIISRGMGGVSAAFSDNFSVNFSNPASYANFQTILEQRSQKLAYGRVVLDVGMNITNRSLTTPNNPKSFTSSDAMFSHVYLGFPIKKNWGVSFGIRPLSRISYNLYRAERLKDPITNLPIDSVVTQFNGSGGSFLPTIGTGFGSNNLHVGFNVGYLFGRKEVATHRVFLNDTVDYAASNHTTNTSFGNIFFNAGIQYKIDLAKGAFLRLGAAGNWKQNLNASQDVLRQTYTRNANGEELRIDSVFTKNDTKGIVEYPSSYTMGIMYEKPSTEKRGLSLGADFVQNNWQDYRFFGARDSLKNNWEMHVGGQLHAFSKPARYGQAISYRFGFFTGQDAIQVKKSLPVYGVSFGMGIPIMNYNRLSLNQYSIVNIGLEYTSRGNDENVLKEKIFRVSVGFNFTDLWFGKRKYE